MAIPVFVRWQGRRVRTGRGVSVAVRGIALGVVTAVATIGCATFPDTANPFDAMPSLSARGAIVTPSEMPAPVDSSSQSADPEATDSAAPSSGAGDASEPVEPDPCAIPELPVVAVCLDQPIGLAVLPDGMSALIGERTTGNIYSVQPEAEPLLVATLDDIDSDGGLLDLTLSPYFVEDNLIYAYVAAGDSARIMRVTAQGDSKEIFSDIPYSAGSDGALIFGGDDLLYVAVGDGGADLTGAEGDSADLDGADGDGADRDSADLDGASGDQDEPLAGTILRLDPFGIPADDNPNGTAVFATGVNSPSGMCVLPDGTVAVVDQRAAADVVLAVTAGAELDDSTANHAIWTYDVGDGGAFDCAATTDHLAATGRGIPRVLSLAFGGGSGSGGGGGSGGGSGGGGGGGGGGFSGIPEDLLGDEYGMLRSITAGPGDLLWITTRNRAAAAAGEIDSADPSDDRVIVISASGGDGGGGFD